uniref:Uncharacterized protein n=1 Tax=Populus trichocarpa TaxID=3694 RepID=A0A2K1Z822_POPTR
MMPYYRSIIPFNFVHNWVDNTTTSPFKPLPNRFAKRRHIDITNATINKPMIVTPCCGIQAALKMASWPHILH